MKKEYIAPIAEVVSFNLTEATNNEEYTDDEGIDFVRSGIDD